jgi:CPA2 family monovalent cation:H+ antiporter-2
MLSGLELALILIAAATLVVVLLRRFGVPPLVAYLAVGVLVAPHASELVANEGTLHTAAELGVVFLMFSLGLEFNLAKLKSLRRFVFGLGGAQVALSAGAFLAILLALPAAWAHWLIPGIDWRLSFTIAAGLALSSTAMVVKLLVERRELETEHGRRIFSVLLFQDLAVIPLLIVIPALSRGADGLAFELGLAFLKAAVLMVLLLRFGPHIMRAWFALVVRTRSHELFTLNVLLSTLLFGWLTQQAGLSMELGAFLAGMMIAETEYRFQVEEDIKPFRDVLLGLFFVTIGARLDPGSLLQSWPQVLGIFLFALVIKLAIVGLLVYRSGAGAGVAVRTALWLSQSGEFAFVLLAQAVEGGSSSHQALQPVTAAILVSLLVSPAIIAQANRIALRFANDEWLRQSMQLQQVASQSMGLRNHVIVCGFGRCGQSLSHVLESEDVPFCAIDNDPDRVRLAQGAGEPVVYGDASRQAMLVAAGVGRARALAITFDDPPQALRLLATLRAVAPQLPVLARCANEADIERLRAAGATEVVPEIAEGSLMIASHAMALAGVPIARVRRRVRNIREGRYSLLQGFFHGADDDPVDSIEADPHALRALPIEVDVRAAGQPLGELLVEGVRAMALVRGRDRFVEPDPAMLLQPGDVLVLSGRIDRLALVEEHWLAPRG